MECPRAALFDLDDTLAESFKAPEQPIIDRLKRLLACMPVAIITGRDFARTEPGFLPLMTESPRADRFFVMPESGALCLAWDGAWKELYTHSLSDADRAHVRRAIEESVIETNVLEGLPCFGEQYVEKRAQTAFAVLGLAVPSELKYTWDPNNVRRSTLQHAIAKRLPEYEVHFGGATSIDVTKRGINKSLGVRWLGRHLGVAPSDMFYVGDAFGTDGNDAVVVETGVQTRPVSGPAETARVLDELLAACTV